MKMTQRVVPLLVGLCAATVAWAEQSYIASFEPATADEQLLQRLEQLEARLANIESQAPSPQLELTGYAPAHNACSSVDQYVSCDTYRCDAYAACESSDGMFGSAELLLFQLFDTDGDDAQASAETASRYTVGYQFDGCHAIRARYFEFAVADDLGAGGSVSTEQLDLEYAGTFAFGQTWSGDISLGGRWATLQTPNPRDYQDTLGPVIGIGLRSEITDCFSIYGGVRQSFQFGTETVDNRSKVFGISELSMGVELSREAFDRELFLRTGVEGQYYSSVRDDEEDYGLIGATFMFGFRR